MTHAQTEAKGADAKAAAMLQAGEEYGGYINCGMVPDSQRHLYRCMGGRFCNHQPGTCTATWPLDKNATYSSKTSAPQPPSERDANTAQEIWAASAVAETESGQLKLLTAMGDTEAKALAGIMGELEFGWKLLGKDTMNYSQGDHIKDEPA